MNIQWVGANENNYTKGRGKPIKKIVLHWIVGTLASADATFANPDRKASAHYGVANSTIHQWVKEGDTAWHAGNWGINQESIGIEHEGGWLLSDGTRKVPTETTHKTSGLLVADICMRYNLPIDRNTIHVHNEYSATACPGSLDVDKIIRYAKEAIPDVPDVGVITEPKTKIDVQGEWGVQELQAVRSILKDQKNSLESCEQAKIDLENAKNKEIMEKELIWQTQLESANSIIEELKKQRASEMDWRTLFSIAWKKWWSWKKGGDNND